MQHTPKGNRFFSTFVQLNVYIRYGITAALIAVLLVVYGITHWYAMAQVAHYAHANKGMYAERNSVARARSKKESHTSSSTIIQRKFRDFASKQCDIAALFDQFQAIPVTLKSCCVGSEENHGWYTTSSIELTLSGSYQDIVQFLDQLQKKSAGLLYNGITMTHENGAHYTAKVSIRTTNFIQNKNPFNFVKS